MAMYSDSLANLFTNLARQPVQYDALMPHRVKGILLVASLYDSYTFVEDGGINDLLFAEYSALNLRQTPRIDRVSTAARALENLKTTSYDLIISMLRIGDMDVREFGRRVKQAQPDLPVLLLAFNARELSILEGMQRLPGIDRIFMWHGDPRIFVAMIMYVEDRLNACHDAMRGGVQIIVLLEDSVQFYSTYLTVLYTEIVKQTQALLSDGLNQLQRIRRQRARPKVLLATSYEEGIDLYDNHKEHVIGVILDASFPRKGKMNPQAGIDFAKRVKDESPDRAVLIQSSDPDMEILSRASNIAFIDKRSPSLSQDVRDFMQRELGFGDFVFRRMDGGVITTAGDLRAFREALEMIPDESLVRHSQSKDFSTWLLARTEFDLAWDIRRRKMTSFETIAEYRSHLVDAIKRHQGQTRAGIVSEFSHATFDGRSGFARIGSKSLGGKGRGLAFLNAVTENYNVRDQVQGVRIGLPPTVALATDVFERFVQLNGLQGLVKGDKNDLEVRQILLRGSFPDDLVQALRTFLSRVRYPLAIRSSSLLEDSSHQPFAGVYKTVMIANNCPRSEVRLEELLNAIRLVYASTFQSDSRNYLESTPNRLEEERMAVLIQQVVGRQHGRYLYPDVAGVARSHNFYPLGDMKPRDGVICAVLGLGKAAMEGGRCLRVSPVSPATIYPLLTPRDFLNNAQREFYALDLRAPGPATEEAAMSYVDMRPLPLKVAHEHGVLDLVGSVYSPQCHEIFDGANEPGVKLVTMAPLFKNPGLNLAGALRLMLSIGEAGLSCPVELEFAATVDEDARCPVSLSLLQIRPMVIAHQRHAVEVDRINRDNALCISSRALGHGIFPDIRDIIYVRQATFSRTATADIAEEIGAVNNALKAANRAYILIGAGRWGSADPRLGIPVTWGQISKVACIVETPLTDLRVNPSQGSHFFQNITSIGIGYFTIDSDSEKSFLNTSWLDAIEAETTTEHVRHVSFEAPLDVVIDSKTGVGAIMKPGRMAPRKRD